ncbi:MAG: MarC family protein [Candidatus Cybelea sp.]|jgi:multiple antibiotic resistance protein
MNHTGGLLSFDTREIFTFLFIMLGPIKLLAPFAKLTATSSESESRSLALRATLIATLTVLAASFIGQAMMAKWNVSPGALAIAGGILFFLVALSLVLDPYTEAVASAASAQAPSIGALLRQLVPKIVTPYGIAAVILLLTLMPEKMIAIVEILVGIMALDLVAMLFARNILAGVAFPLQILGTVMGVLQVALSVQIIVYGIRLIAVQSFGITFGPAA